MKTLYTLEDHREIVQYQIIRHELTILPALRAMDAAWLRYVEAPAFTEERRLLGVAFMESLAAYNTAWAVYDAMMSDYRREFGVS